MYKKIRLMLAKPFWFINDQADLFNRAGCYVAWGKNWRERDIYDPR